VRVDGVAQVGGDALAEPGDGVETRRREHAERGAHREQRQEVLAQRHHAFAGVGGDQALVDQHFQRHREGQRAERGHHQEHAGQRDVAAVRPHEGQQAGQRAHALAGGVGRRGRVCCGQR
jgi:hypothetical protein